MSAETFQDRVNQQRKREIEEATSAHVRKQQELDFWWEINLARQAQARQRRTENPETGDYNPVARYDQEADYKQADADRRYGRGW
jgi:hypothetical protein